MPGETHPPTSLAIWDFPSTAVAGEPFTIKVGAKSSTDCSLAGGRLEVRDAAGAAVASGQLGEARWPGTGALHWTELTLRAPAQHGTASFSVRLDAAGLAPPHRNAASEFVVMVVPPPAHTLTIRVVAQEGAAPIPGVDIRLGPYRASTGASGQASVRVARGQYDLYIWKVGYEAPPRPVMIDADASVEIEAIAVPEENADRAWRA